MKKLPRSLTPAANFLARHSAIIALAVFAVVGAAVFDDYGIGSDEGASRGIGVASFGYILGDENALIEGRHDRFFGAAFEVPLIAAERILGLEDSRDIYLSRRLLTHLSFLTGGFFAWLLTYRLFGSRLIALLAMLLFLLHPRIYAHSFFNSRDVPFLSMFMIALYLTHRAFRRESVWAFALCGAGAGLLVNIRIMGVMLIPAVLGMLALDALYAVRREGGAKRILASICAFSAMSAATLYAAWPALWRDPRGAAVALGLTYEHPNPAATLFRGEFVQHPNIPWDFIPTWISITTPPVALILAAIGVGVAARLCAADWRDALANSTARFGLLALVCLTLPVAAVVALNSNMFNGWRHVYFLYAPICVLAAFGLRALADIPRPSLRAGALAAAALGIAIAAVQMVQMHPYQNDYFNSLVDKSELADRWEMNYWRVYHKKALDALLEMQPSGRIAVMSPNDGPGMERNTWLVPPDDRRRLSIAPAFPSFHVFVGDGGDDAFWTLKVYGVPVASIVDVRAESEAAVRAILAAARASEPAASAGGFDIYADGGALAYIKEDCVEEDTRGLFGLAVFPVDQSDLLQTARDGGQEYQSLNFEFSSRGAALDGKCVAVRDLPEFPISHVETGQYIPGESRLWNVLIPLGGYHERYRRALASLSDKQPAIRSDFDVYLKDGSLTYVKENCAQDDARGRFFLSVFPEDPSDLSQYARDAGLGHEPLNFDFERGAIFDGKCAIIRDLPDYPISRIETGQFIPGEGELWSARLVVGDGG